MVAAFFRAIDVPDLEGMKPEEAKEALLKVDLALDRIAQGKWDDGEVIEAEVPTSLNTVKNTYYKNMNSLVDKLQSGKIGVKDYDKQVKKLIDKNFEKAYRDGRGKELDAGDKLWLKRATDAEMDYAKSFGRDVKEGRGRKSYRQRAEDFSRTIDAAWWNGKVESQPDDVVIRWVLGLAEHCDSCLLLSSSSPFNKWNLPTTPRAGATPCLSRCKCKLVFVKGKMSKAEREDAAEYEWRKNASVADLLGEREAPKGLRIPTQDERKHIDDLRATINFHRRRIASGALDKDDLADAIMRRKMANAELIEFVDVNKIHEVPVWSVDDVIDGRHIGQSAVEEIFDEAIDASLLEGLTEKELDALLGRYEKEIGKAFITKDLLKDLKK